MTGQAVNEFKSLLLGPASVAGSGLPTNNLLFTSSPAEESAKKWVLSHRREWEEVTLIGNAVRARVQLRRVPVDESDNKWACDMGRGELDSERLMMTSESSDGDHLLMEVRKDAKDIFDCSSRFLGFS